MTATVTFQRSHDCRAPEAGATVKSDSCCPPNKPKKGGNCRTVAVRLATNGVVNSIFSGRRYRRAPAGRAAG
jgi:hypothetical protein